MSYAEWADFVYYTAGNIVSYLGVTYEALQQNINEPPTGLAPNWIVYVNPPPAAPQVLSQSGNDILLSGGGGSVDVSTTTLVAATGVKTTAMTYDAGLLFTSITGDLFVERTEVGTPLTPQPLTVNGSLDVVIDPTGSVTLTNLGSVLPAGQNVLYIDPILGTVGQGSAPAGSWVGTAASDLNMNGYNITSPSDLDITSTTNVSVLGGSFTANTTNDVILSSTSGIVGLSAVANDLTLNAPAIKLTGNSVRATTANLTLPTIPNASATKMLYYNPTLLGKISYSDPPAGSWVGTAASDLNMNGYNITNSVNVPMFISSTGSLSIGSASASSDTFYTSGKDIYINTLADKIIMGAGSDVDITSANGDITIDTTAFGGLSGSVNVTASTAVTVTAATVSVAGTLDMNANPITDALTLNDLTIAQDALFNMKLGDAFAGEFPAGGYAIAIGASAGGGGIGQGDNAIAIGNTAGSDTQGVDAIAIGAFSGGSSQGDNSIAIGRDAGQTTQSASSVAIGISAGNSAQGSTAVAIGSGAGALSQSTRAVAIGNSAGSASQGINAVAVGWSAGNVSQGLNAIAVGRDAGKTSQGISACAFGFGAGSSGQGTSAVAIGENAGALNQGANSIAIGKNAITSGGSFANTTVINATGVAINPAQASSCYIAPVRAAPTATAYQSAPMLYNPTTFEVSYGSSFFTAVLATAPSTIALNATLRGRTYIATSAAAAALTFTNTLTANDTGFYVKVKNGNGVLGFDITIVGATGNLTVFKSSATSNGGIVYLYWTGAALVAY